MSQRYLGGIITANPTTPTMTSESGVWTLEQQFQYSSVWSPEIIGNSLRFRQSATAYLSRTYGTPTSTTTGTISFWYKRGLIGSGTLITAFGTVSTTTGNGQYIQFSNDSLRIIDQSSDITTNAVFRDPSAWYHIVVAIDTTQATAANRILLYVNGVQYTSFSSATYGSQNYASTLLASGSQYIGYSQPSNARGSDGYMAECYFVDGQALAPTSFGAYDSTGVWQPLPYTGTYGANGFYIDFSDNSGTTSTTLGKDYSGNGNNWTPNNFSLTAGTTYDWMLDSPTNSDNGGTGRGNYAVLNPLVSTSGVLSQANLVLSLPGGSTNTGTAASFVMTTGKWYWEVTATGTLAAGDASVGVCDPATSGSPVSNNVNFANNSAIVYPTSGSSQSTRVNGSAGATLTGSFASGNVLMIAFDADAKKIWFGGNGTWFSNGGTGDPAAGTNPSASSIGGSSWWPLTTAIGGTFNSQTQYYNFGQRPFAYTPPSGFKALNTQNLSTPTIMNGAQYMAATTYTGTGATQTISNGANTTIGTAFKPDLIWGKQRNGTSSNVLTDSVRGVNAQLSSNLTNAEASNTDCVTAFGSTGFTVGASAGYNMNQSGSTLVAWQWQAGQGTTSSNTSGSITSTVSVNATAGFSVVTFTSPGGSAQTIGHGLGVAPSLIIMKSRNNVSGWTTYHSSVGNTGALNLQATTATSTSIDWWNNTSPTSSVWTIGANVNLSTWTWVAYCWAAVAGYSAFGTYTGNGSSDGTFVYLGFRPRYLLLKLTNTTGSWQVKDSSRNTYNATDLTLYPNLSNAEASDVQVDFLSNGFKLRTATGENANGNTVVYAAFAENPFKISRAR